MEGPQRLVVASTWAFSPECAMELRDQVSGGDVVGNGFCRYDSSRDVFIVDDCNALLAAPGFGKMISDFVSSNESYDDLGEVGPKLRRLAVADGLRSDLDEIFDDEDEDENEENHGVSLIDSDGGNFLANNRRPQSVVKHWEPSISGSLPLLLQTQFNLLRDLSRTTDATLEFDEKNMRITVTGDYEYIVDDTLERLSNLENPLWRTVNPKTINVLNLPTDVEQRIVVRQFRAINSHSVRRILINDYEHNPKIIEQVPHMYTTIGMQQNSETHNFEMPKAIREPPVSRSVGKAYPSVWAGYCFCQLGDPSNRPDAHLSANNALPASATGADSQAPVVSHHLLSKEKASLVDRYITASHEAGAFSGNGPSPNDGLASSSHAPAPGSRRRQLVGASGDTGGNTNGLSQASQLSTSLLARNKWAEQSSPDGAPTMERKPFNISDILEQDEEEDEFSKTALPPSNAAKSIQAPKRALDLKAILAEDDYPSLPPAASQQAQQQQQQQQQDQQQQKQQARPNQSVNTTFSELRSEQSRQNTMSASSLAPADSLSQRPSKVPPATKSSVPALSNSLLDLVDPSDVDNTRPSSSLAYQSPSQKTLQEPLIPSRKNSPSPQPVSSSTKSAAASTSYQQQGSRTFAPPGLAAPPGLKPPPGLGAPKASNFNSFNFLNNYDTGKPSRSPAPRNLPFQRGESPHKDQPSSPAPSSSSRIRVLKTDQPQQQRHHRTMRQQARKKTGTEKNREAMIEALFADERKPQPQPQSSQPQTQSRHNVQMSTFKKARVEKKANEVKEKIRNFSEGAKQLLETGYYFPGNLKFEMQMGLILVNPKLQENTLNMVSQVKLWNDLFRPKHSFLQARTYFTSMLTSSGSDVDYILRLEDGKKPHQKRLFEEEPCSRRVSYEFHCQTKNNDTIIISIDETGMTEVTGPESKLGIVNVHCPNNVWDMGAVLRGTMEYKSEVDEQVDSAIEDFLDRLYIPPGEKIMIYTRMPDGSVLHVEKALMKRSTRHRIIDQRGMNGAGVGDNQAAGDGVAGSMKNPENADEAQDDILLQVTEVQALFIAVLRSDKDFLRFKARSPQTMIDQHRLWYEVSVVSPSVEQVLSTNKDLVYGDKTDVWSAVDLLGGSGSASPDESQPASTLPPPFNHNQGIIGDMFLTANTLVEKIDEVGAANWGPGPSIEAEQNLAVPGNHVGQGVPSTFTAANQMAQQANQQQQQQQTNLRSNGMGTLASVNQMDSISVRGGQESNADCFW